MDLDGILWKQRRGLHALLLGNAAWHKRNVRLDARRQLLSWASPDGGRGERKTLDLNGAVMTPTAEAEMKLKRRFVIEVTKGNETVSFGAESEDQRAKWATAIHECITKGASSLSSVMASLGASVGQSSPGTAQNTGSASGGSSDVCAKDLPSIVYIDGAPEPGAELRVRVKYLRDQRMLEPLGIQWYRLPSSALPRLQQAQAAINTGSAAAAGLLSSDFLASFPDAKSVPGATFECYSLSHGRGGADYDKLLAVVVRSTSGPGTRWSVTSRPCTIGAADGSSADDALSSPSASSDGPRVAISLVPHEHSKYCDRRVRVCTAPGKYREGAVLKAQFGPPLTSSSEASAAPSSTLPAGYALAWYRSDVVDDSQLSPPDRSNTSYCVGGDADSRSTANGGPSQPHVGTVSTATSGIAAALADVTYRRVLPRPVSDLPPAPPDHVPSTPLAELKQRLAVVAQPRPLPDETSSATPASSSVEYPLFADDVGRMLLATLVPLGSLLPPTLRPHQRFRRRQPPVAGGVAGWAGGGLVVRHVGGVSSASSSSSSSASGTPTSPEPSSSAAAAARLLFAANASHEDGRSGGVVHGAGPVETDEAVNPLVATGHSNSHSSSSSSGGSSHVSTPKVNNPLMRNAAAGGGSTAASSEETVVGPHSQQLTSTSSSRSDGESDDEDNDGMDVKPVVAVTSDVADVRGVVPRPPQRARPAASPSAASSSDNGSPGTSHSATPSGLILSAPVGPVEAAPPKARELWIEGATRVGSLLVGRMYYYGGSEGSSVVSWVGINADGETVELKPPTEAPPPPPDEGASSQLLPDSHPRALRLRPEHVGCLIKFKVTPVRSDGDRGHTESSRPTAEVEPA